MRLSHAPIRLGGVVALLAIAAAAPCAVAQAPAQAPAPHGTIMNGDRYPFVQADVDFLQGMIAHHAQAVVMSGWAPTHGASRGVQTFAGRIALAQTSEIGTMGQWLRDHHQAVPVPTLAESMGQASMAGMKMDSLMPGMLSAAQMKQLDAARGVGFDRLFLRYMIQHHTGAIQMVTTLFGTNGAGQDDYIFKYANDVQADQITEINRMQQMLDALPPDSSGS
jgi:uncharacterized protein (DUF305 family)